MQVVSIADNLIITLLTNMYENGLKAVYKYCLKIGVICIEFRKEKLRYWFITSYNTI